MVASESPRRRSSDEILARLDVKVDNFSEVIDRHRDWLIKHEDRIQSCEKQHVWFKGILAALVAVWAMVTWFLDWRK